MKTSISLFLLAGAMAVAQPIVNQGGVLNAASYGLDSLPNSGLAQGGIFTVFGYGLGLGTLQRATFPLPTTLGGTSIKVTAGGVAVDAIMVYTLASQVAAILPSRTPAGPGVLTLTYNGRTSPPVPIGVVRTNFGIFARNAAGSGPAVVQNYVSPAEIPFNSPIESAHPNQVLVLWGTGLGPVNVDEANPPGLVDPGTEVEVWVGGKRAAVQYKGRTPNYAGEDQINFQLPSDVPQGCYVPVAIKAGGRVSNFTSIAVAAQGKVCSDPHGPPATDLQRVANGESLRLGWVQLLRENFTLGLAGSIIGQGKADLAWADFFRWDAATVGQSAALNSVAGLAMGTCTVISGSSSLFNALIPRGGQRLNVGTAVNLRGPVGSKRLPPDPSGIYEKNALGVEVTPLIFPARNPPFLNPGAFTVDNGAGGPDAAAFQLTLNIPGAPAPLTWTNLDSIQTIDRSQDVTVTWTGGDPTREFVLIGGGVNLPWARAILACIERPDAGRLVIPSVVLSALPSSPVDTTASFFGGGRVPLLGINRVVSGGLDAAYFSSAEMTLKNITYR